MTNQEIDEQYLDGSIWEDETGNNSAQEDDNESWTNKNTSNFKALYKSKKELEVQLAIEREEREQERLELKQWRELNADTAKEIDSNKDYSSLKEEMFTLKNPEAEPHLKLIKEAMWEYNMDFAKAWKFVKIDLPVESISKTDFNISKSAVKKPIDLKNVPFSETESLTKEQRSEWRKIHYAS